jgi:hypothetical protein
MHVLTAIWCLLGALAVEQCSAYSKIEIHQKDLAAVKDLRPLKEGSSVFFWRPQKVGSSTLLSILMSYGFRYNFLPRRKSTSNSYCRKFAKCAIMNKGNSTESTHNESLGDKESMEAYVMQRVPGGKDHGKVRRRDLESETLADSLPYKISLTHEICNLGASVVEATLPCTFAPRYTSSAAVRSTYPEVKELLMVREPLSRAISVYYFWGELFKMRKQSKRHRSESERSERSSREREKRAQAVVDGDRGERGHGGHRRALQGRDGDRDRGGGSIHDPMSNKLGHSTNVTSVNGGKFNYHGDESTPPPLDFAMAYADKKIYRPGMPGPSNIWSLFADNIADAVDIIATDRICTIVLERLHESLVVASHYLGWSLADMVVTLHRKAQSIHPKYTQWPASAVALLRQQLEAPLVGEFLLYNASVRKLDERVARLEREGVRVGEEVERLRQLEERATKVSHKFIFHYSYFIFHF